MWSWLISFNLQQVLKNHTSFQFLYSLHPCYGMSTNTVYHTSYKRCLICLCFFLSWKNKEDDHKKNKKGTAKKNTKCCKTLQPVQEKAGHCTSLLTAPRTGIHFSKARTLLAHGDMVSLRHCENTLVLLRISESHTQCVIHKAVWCWLACYWIPHMAQWGDNSAEIVSISVKRSGLFIGIEEGEITERLPEDLPSGRDNSEPKSGTGCNAVCFFFRDWMWWGVTGGVKQTSCTDLCVRGQTACPKRRTRTRPWRYLFDIYHMATDSSHR